MNTKIVFGFLLAYLWVIPLSGQYKIFDLKGEPFTFIGNEIEMSPDGRQLYLLETKGGVYHTSLWELNGNTYQYRQLIEQSFIAEKMAVSDDFKRILFVGNTNNVNQLQAYARVVEMQGNEAVPLGAPIEEGVVTGNFDGYALSTDGSTVALCDYRTGNGYAIAYRYDGTDWKQLGDTIRGTPDKVLGHEIALSADGGRLAVTLANQPGFASNVAIYELSDDKWTNISFLEDAGYQIKLSSDGATLYGVAIDNIFKVHQETNGAFSLLHNELDLFRVFGFCLDMEVSKNGEHIIMGSVNNASNAAYVSIIDKVENEWVERPNLFYNNRLKEYFGSQVEITDDGSRLLIGQQRYELNKGRIYGFVDAGYSSSLYLEAFIDVNENEIYDEQEKPLNQVQFVVDEVLTYLPNDSGGVNLLLTEGTYGLKTIVEEGFQEIDEMQVKLEGQSMDSIFVPVKPQLFYYEYKLKTGLPRCNSRQQLNLELSNLGLSSISAKASIEYTTVDSLTYSTPPIFEDTGYVEIISEVFGYGETYNILIDYNIPGEAFIGDTLIFKINLAITDESTGDIDTLQLLLAREIRCAFDPNDKAVSPIGFGDKAYTSKTIPLTYRVRFQNTGNLPATTVIVEDTISEHLDFSTFKLLEASHPITATEYQEGTLKFIFENINLLDSVSNEPESHGHVLFQLSPYSNLAEGTIVENTAFIYFDLNEAVVTNTVSNTLITDKDLDRYILSEDCDDNNPLINPAAVEIANNEIDEDCNGLDLITATQELPNTTIKIYPNPTTSNVVIEVVGLSRYTVNLYTIDGRPVHTLVTPNFIEMESLPKGIYFLEIQDNQVGKRIVDKIVKY